jgi:RNA polymerase sigma-70 factor (ECF subfamily)
MATGTSVAEQFLQGIPTAFDELVREYQGGLLRVSRSILRDENMAQDAVQETFIRLLKQCDTINDASKLNSWLFRTCRNISIDFIRKDQRIKDLSEKVSLDSTGISPSPDSSIEQSDMIRYVHETMKRLTPNESSCILLKMIEEKSYKEIAVITGLSVSNVGFQIHNGLKRLAGFLKLS